MRLLHTADLHLGKILHEQSLLDDQAEVLDQIAAELHSGDYDLFVVAGDVFDRSVPPPEATALWDDFLHRVATENPRLTVVAVPGNHDGALRLGFASRFLAASRIHLRTRTDDLDRAVTLSIDGTEWDIFAVPFLMAGTLETHQKGEPQALRTQRDLWEEACRRLAAARRPGVPAVLVTHLFTLGGTEAESERMFVGEAEQIPASWLAGWDYVALGHLHRPQEPAPGVRYSGSPLAYSFSEAGQDKVVLRWEDGQVTPVALKPRRPLTRIEGTFDDLARGPGYEGLENHWLEVTLTDEALVPSPLERLRVRFPGLLSLRQKPSPGVTTSPDTSGPHLRRTGDLTADALRFLTDVGVPPPSGAAELLAALAQEALDAAP